MIHSLDRFYHFERACMALSSDGGFADFLSAKFDGRKHIVQEYPLTNRQKDFGYEIVISHEDLSGFAIEYGLRRIKSELAAYEAANPQLGLIGGAS